MEYYELLIYKLYFCELYISGINKFEDLVI